jgi:hypothetical protein
MLKYIDMGLIEIHITLPESWPWLSAFYRALGKCLSCRAPQARNRQSASTWQKYIFFFEDVQYTFSLREEKEIQRSDFWGT